MFGSAKVRLLSRTLLASAVLSGFSLHPVLAQELRGRVQGSVADSSGAAIAGATVRLINDQTGVSVVRTTTPVGQYIFDFVVAGNYTLEVEQTGFRKFVQRNILVQTRSDVTIDPVMELGAVTETVNVTAAPVQVKFNTTSMDLTLDTKMTNDLPIIHRNPFLLATLNPAVVVRSTTEQSPYHHWAANQLDVGGGTSTKNDILVDGVPQLVGAKGSYVPPMDAVSEVNVQQNAVDAEFGHSAGGIISVQMKGGTNEWHGTAYYFGRNPALNAIADRTTFRPNMVRNNVWGATSQNPIIRNKLFNFFAYESHNVREPRTMALTLPTQLERTGDFSQSRTISGGLRTIYDPLTTVFNSAQNTATRQAFPGNVIPANRIDSTAAKFMADIWLPNNPGDNITGANNFRETYPQKFEYYNISDRVDWAINDKWRAFGRISGFKTTQSDPDFTGSPAQNMAGSARNTIQTSGDVVYLLDPATVLNVRGSYSKINDSFYAENALVERSFFEQLWPGNPWYDLYFQDLPALYYPGLDVRAETRSQFGRDGFWYQEPKTWNIQAKISRQMGSHYAKIGGEFRQQLVLAARPRPMVFQFDKDHTAATFIRPDLRTSGDAYASMLLGVISDNSRIQNIPLNRPRNGFWGLYAQDDWKVTQNLTLNLGLRWEYQSAIYDPEDRLSRFLDLTEPIPEFQGANAPVMPAEVQAIRPGAPVYNGAWIFTDSENRGAWNPPLNMFLPRAGIALRLNDRTALRLGYARYAVASDSATAIVDVLGSTPYQGFDQTTNPLPVLEGRPQAALSNPYPAGVNPLIPPVGKTLGRYTGLGTDTLWFAQDWRNETNDRINLSFQRQLPGMIVMDLTWFMNFGHNAPQNIPVNMADPRLSFEHKAALSRSVPNPFYQVLPPDKFPGQLRNQRNVTVGTLLRPYPHYGELTERGVGMSRTRYSAIQIQVQRPFANGFNLLFGYNYNNGRSEEFYDNVDQYDRAVSWQSTNFTLPQHKLTAAGIYQLPFGRGRPMLNNANRVVDAILGGWALSGIYQYTSGTLLQFGGLEVIGDPEAEDPGGALFNTAAFRLLPAFTRRANPWMYDGINGPIFSNLDLTLAKEFAITERVRFELKMESYNFTNSFMGANPSMDVNSSVFGKVVQQRAGYSGRQFQYNARFRW